LTEYVHRLGRTARVGRAGKSISFILPGQESEWIKLQKQKMNLGREISVEQILKLGFGGKDKFEYETRATDVQMSLERLVINGDEKYKELAKRAFSSFVRAYGTHPKEEKEWFNIKSLHLGHVAKSFGLREAPSGIGGKPIGGSEKRVKHKRVKKSEGLKTMKGPDGRGGDEFRIGGVELVEEFDEVVRRKEKRGKK
jgi:ATP-dependent RNA helicase DDX31/DBP7